VYFLTKKQSVSGTEKNISSQKDWLTVFPDGSEWGYHSCSDHESLRMCDGCPHQGPAGARQGNEVFFLSRIHWGASLRARRRSSMQDPYNSGWPDPFIPVSLARPRTCAYMKNCCNRCHTSASEPGLGYFAEKIPKVSAIFYKVNLQCI
jgi:hypothetical protein